MSRGGARDNAGRKSGWVNVETKLIRIPVMIESQLIAIAKKLDQGEIIDFETKSIEIESVTESKLDSVTDSIKEIVDRYKKESDAATPKNTRWDNARKLLSELEPILYPEIVIESVTESITIENDSVTDSEEINNDLVTESKAYKIEQFELIPDFQKTKLEPLSQPDLAIRLQVSDRAMRNHKDDFAEWSKSKDPSGVSWERREDKKYHPLNV
jgi:hypothetical protein